MPRRRASKATPSKSKGKKGGSIQRWDTREDIPLDEVDEFYEQRDKILLEGEEPAADSDYDEDEVFALKGLAESSEDEGSDEVQSGVDEDEAEVKSPEKRKKKSKPSEKRKKDGKGKKTAESSDEQSEEEEEEEEESWGLKKSTYYSSNAAQIESDDEDAREMEEQEARRLQAKLRAPMREEDFGYGEALQNAVDLKPVGDFWKPPEKSISVTAGADKNSVLRHLQKTNPEALALAFEWEDIAKQVITTGKKIAEMPNDEEDKALGLAHMHHQTLLTYASLLAFYLHLRASEKYAARPELLRQHPIMKRLLTLKQSIITFEELDFAASESESDELDSEEDDFDESDLDSDLDDLDMWMAAKKLGLEVGELGDLLAQANAPVKKLPKVKLRVREKTDEEKDDGRKQREPPKKKQRKLDGTAAPKVDFDVEEPMLPSESAPSSSSTSTKEPKSTSAESFGFGEATSLDEADLADKKGRRKALRFHTAKIESASARRQGARTALGGDDDVPYRERNREKQKRSKNLGAGGDDLDDAEPESREQRSQKRGRKDENNEESGEEDDEDGYYSLVKRQKKAKQTEKKAAYEATKEANRVDFEDDSVQGQRSASRAILANKGLTPKRSKSVRNPRVKKRQKFEKAKKKLASQKAIYKGGIGDPNSYTGEKSGISKVVKSVKL